MMKDKTKTKKQLINELVELRHCLEVLQSVVTCPPQTEEKGHEDTRDLEKLIAEQTAELRRTNVSLKAEVREREKALELLQESMELLEIIFSNIHFLVAYVDKDFNYIRVNDAYANTSGHQLEYFVGKNHFDLYPNSENEAIFRKVLETAESYDAFERHFEFPNIAGEKTYWDWSVHAVRNVEGEVSGLILTLVDVTDRKRAEEKIRLYTEELERSNQELQEFAYVASHDLQEPLRKIRTFGDRLGSKYAYVLDQQGQDYLKRMLNAANRGQVLIDALLTYSRVSTKAQPFTLVNLKEVVQEALSNLETRIQESNGKIEVADLPVIEADPNQMLQLMENLISNAIKFRHAAEPPSVKIRARVVAAPKQEHTHRASRSFVGKLCEIRVEDSGIGFDEKHQDHIFAPFWRLHSRAQYDGVGMGLAICRKIAERHSGTILAKSTPGVGSTFIVTLPLEQHRGMTYN
jgi:PAS domain S-box-containing protein